MDNGVSFEIWGLGGAIVVGLIIEVLKRVLVTSTGEHLLNDRITILVALLVGVILSALTYLGQKDPTFLSILNMVGAGLLAGLSAGGVYSLLKHRE